MATEPQDAFEALIARNRARLWRLARSYARGDLATDLYQEMLMQVWRTLDRFKGHADIDTWVYRVAINTALTYRKQAAREPVQADVGSAALEEMPGPSSDATREAAILEDFVRTLAGMDKVVFVLYLEDLSYKEMAEITGLTESHVGVKINRLKQRYIDRFLSG